jgi:hypothetical protein
MALFRLKAADNDLSKAELLVAQETNLRLEAYLEGWLERSPWALAQEPLLWIGRQTPASVQGGIIFPDLLGVDSEGNLVIVELKKGKAPREVMAQLLEYAAWANELSDERIHEIAATYFQTRSTFQGMSFQDVFSSVFETDETPVLNQRLRLFILAEEIPDAVARVCRFLRTSHGIDVSCVAVSTFQTQSEEILVSTEVKVGEENVVAPKRTQTLRWSGEKPVKQVVWEAIQELTQGGKDVTFAPKDITTAILKKYPNFNRSAVGCQIISDCVNHRSRHHYPGGDDRYWWIEKGKYRLYDSERDKVTT